MDWPGHGGHLGVGLIPPAGFRRAAEGAGARPLGRLCTTIHHILRAPRRIVGQVFNLRRIFNPPAALDRARHDRRESPTLFAACRYARQFASLGT
jgi:hypothetical protein